MLSHQAPSETRQRAVEIAIEQDKQTAIDWLESVSETYNSIDKDNISAYNNYRRK